MSKFESTEEVIDELFRAWCVVGFIRQAVNSTEGDEVPFSGSLLEGTLQVAEDMLGSVHGHFMEIAEAKAVTNG